MQCCLLFIKIIRQFINKRVLKHEGISQNYLQISSRMQKSPIQIKDNLQIFNTLNKKHAQLKDYLEIVCIFIE